ncbi:hypothetical protein CPL00146S_CDS0105 [Escherichia phage SmurfNell]|uniref:Uncharacterized protein n=2 Tax=unclassified Caudoviricetes TaxID=2788787 RepID=A0AAU8GJD7_9CAUD
MCGFTRTILSLESNELLPSASWCPLSTTLE